LTIRKRPEGAETKAKAKKTARPAAKRAAPAAGPRRAAKSAPAGPGARPRIHASHARPEGGPKRVARARVERGEGGHEGRQGDLIPPLKSASPAGGARLKRPLGGPKRAGKPRAAAEPTAAGVPEPSNASRELALALSAAGLEKKAIGVEILDVTGKVDYADFLVVMTGRSDRHVHAIATGLEEEMRKRRLSPLSMEGLTAATWVLLDFGDVVVHVFQEEARALYDIEGLWIDAGRVPVPDADPDAAAKRGAPPS
jgi:ribosome-associated protein